MRETLLPTTDIFSVTIVIPLDLLFLPKCSIPSFKSIFHCNSLKIH